VRRLGDGGVQGSAIATLSEAPGSVAACSSPMSVATSPVLTEVVESTRSAAWRRAMPQGPRIPVIAAAVERAIEDDDWEPLDEPVNAAMAMRVFERGTPLEHVRFWDDPIRSREPDRAELAKMCTAGWLRRCEIEIAYVLDRYELDAEERDGLRRRRDRCRDTRGSGRVCACGSGAV